MGLNEVRDLNDAFIQTDIYLVYVAVRELRLAQGDANRILEGDSGV